LSRDNVNINCYGNFPQFSLYYLCGFCRLSFSCVFLSFPLGKDEFKGWAWKISRVGRLRLRGAFSLMCWLWLVASGKKDRRLEF